MYTLTDSAPAGMSLLDYPAPAGRVIAGAFDDALETNPVPMFMLARELNQMRQVGPKLSRESALEEAKRRGVDVKVPEDGISALALGMLIDRRQDQAARDLLFARREGFVAGAGVFGAGLAGALMDPLNAASGFIPVLSGTRYAGALATAATRAGRAGVRLGVGAAEGAVGAGLVELPTIALRRELQDDYGLYDSLANVAFGTFANAGIRGVSGLLRDRWRGLQAARQEDFLRSVEPAEWEAQRRAYQAQLERDMDAELRGGFERGEGPSEGLTQRWSEDRAAAERLRQTDEDIARMKIRMSDAEIKRFAEAEDQMRRESAAPGADDRLLLDAAGVAERKFREMELQEVRERLASGQGLIIVPGNARETAAAIKDETHAQALKTAVAQAAEGRRIDVEPVLRQDPIFGPQRMSQEEVRRRARSNMSPENKIAADPEASARADAVIKAEAPAAVRAEPPPPRGPGAAGAEAPKSPELTELEERLKTARAEFEAAAKEAGVEIPEPKPEDKAAMKRAQDYEKAWEAVATCVKGKGV